MPRFGHTHHQPPGGGTPPPFLLPLPSAPLFQCRRKGRGILSESGKAARSLSAVAVRSEPPAEVFDGMGKCPAHRGAGRGGARLDWRSFEEAERPWWWWWLLRGGWVVGFRGMKDGYKGELFAATGGREERRESRKRR
uniref:DUF834 domain-containing protein n=1 Tax=Oryza brachyantha TaxID=4533 RepID=J3LMZ3_ORYBR